MSEHVFIAGATSDLGRGLVWQLAKRHIPLLIADTSAEALALLADELISAGLPEPQLIAIHPTNLELGSHELSMAISGITIRHWLWLGYSLSNPTPVQHLSLSAWQTHLMQNITYPLWLLKACLATLNSQSHIWFALPNTEAFTHGLGASNSLWKGWLQEIAQEIGNNAPQTHIWSIPRIADRVHRRIWPLAPVEDFIAIDDVINDWLAKNDSMQQHE
jgi:hypothetical protein